jgi:probable metal-binding protein
MSVHTDASTTNASSIHGHEVINLIASAKPALTRAALSSEVVRQFGREARFHTCSTTGMTLEALLAFLVSRGKVVDREGRLHVVLSNVCQH